MMMMTGLENTRKLKNVIQCGMLNTKGGFEQTFKYYCLSTIFIFGSSAFGGPSAPPPRSVGRSARRPSRGPSALPPHGSCGVIRRPLRPSPCDSLLVPLVPPTGGDAARGTKPLKPQTKLLLEHPQPWMSFRQWLWRHHPSIIH